MSTYPRPTRKRVARTRAAYQRWLFDEYGPLDLRESSAELLFLYAGHGNARYAANTDEQLSAIQEERWSDVNAEKLKTWKSSVAFCENVAYLTEGLSVGEWLLLPGWWEMKWTMLQKVHGIGPKIASWLLRDLSFFRDHGADVSDAGIRVAPGRDSVWFDTLSPKDQALFIPLDTHVLQGADAQGALSPEVARNAHRLYNSKRRYREAALAFTNWSRDHKFDPREVDVFWYWNGRGWES